ncbi:Stage 0 sporulation A-like protein, partial [Dysosmobacter welbionis]
GSRSRPLPQTRSTTWARPWRAPHTRKVHPAPCQKPLTRKTMRILQYVRIVPRRLPPRGKYRHSRRKVVSVMCHRFQNSVTEA